MSGTGQTTLPLGALMRFAESTAKETAACSLMDEFTVAPFSAYDPDAVRLLSVSLSDAMEVVRKSVGRPPTDIEAASVSKRIADNLMEVFDGGQRDRSALNRAALEAISAVYARR